MTLEQAVIAAYGNGALRYDNCGCATFWTHKHPNSVIVEADDEQGPEPLFRARPIKWEEQNATDWQPLPEERNNED